MFFMSFIVQINPFLMTLRRKNLLGKNGVVTIYGCLLVFANIFMLNECSTYSTNGFNSFWCQNLIASFGALLRLGPRIPLIRQIQTNKYLLWLLLSLVMARVRPIFDEPLRLPLVALSVGAHIAVVTLGACKAGLCKFLYHHC
jgi:hypothetical protein